MQSPDREGGKGVGSRELTVDEAQRIAVTIARLPELLGAKRAGPFPLGRIRTTAASGRCNFRMQEATAAATRQPWVHRRQPLTPLRHIIP